MAEPKRIFVVDDDPVICDLLADILSTDYRVSTQCDPRAAVQDIACSRLDLLILDLNMPGLDGTEAIPIIRGMPDCGAVPIIVLSAYNDARERVKGLDVQAVMNKPFELAKLLTTITGLLPADGSGRMQAA